VARGVRRALLSAALYAIGALAAVLPATIHNYARSGEVILVCWNGGAALYAGNERWNTSGMYAPPPFSTATIQSEITDYWREAERRAGRRLSPAESSAYWTREALREMAEVPALSAARVGRRLRWAFGDYELQDSRTYAFYAERLPSLGGPRWGFGGLAVVGLLGAVASLRDRRVTFLVAIVASYSGALALFFVYGRYRLPLAVPLAVLGGALAERVAGWIRARRLAATGACAVLGIGLAVVLYAAPFAHRESFFVDYNNLAVAYQEQGRIEEALVEFEKAVTVRPGDDPGVSAIATELAMVFWRRGEHDRARALLREVLRARPGDQDVAAVLATLERL
jgi:tetratricopeptide (TPR) repeat protein